MKPFDFVQNRKTRFISKYDYGNGVVDLGEIVLSYATSCNLGCEYCYLNFVKTPKEPVLYKNKELMFMELKDFINNAWQQENIYINCGETTDSLLTNDYVTTAEQIIDFLLRVSKGCGKKITVEVRTKTGNVVKMKDVSNKQVKVVYSTSLIPENIRINIEPHTTCIDERINLLNCAIDKGMLIGLRFEPIIMKCSDKKDTDVMIKEMMSEYEELIRKTIGIIAKNMDKIHTISLSTLRFTRAQLKHFIDKKSTIVWPEIVVCPDGKYRYSRPIRIEIYKKLIKLLSKYFGDEFVKKIYLATEFDYIWQACGLEVKRITDFG